MHWGIPVFAGVSGGKMRGVGGHTVTLLIPRSRTWFLIENNCLFWKSTQARFFYNLKQLVL